MHCICARQIYTGEGVVDNASLVFAGPTIAEVGAPVRERESGMYDVVTPAFVDSHAHIGLARAGEPSAEAEFTEKSAAFTAGADALDSVQMDDQSFVDSIQAGVLYSCVIPGSENLIAGRCSVIRNYGANTTEAFIRTAGVKAALGYNPINPREADPKRPTTRMGALALLRARFQEVRDKLERHLTVPQDGEPQVSFTADEEVLKAILSGEEVLRVHVHKNDDIASLLRLVDETGVRVVIEHAGDVHDVKMFQELRSRDIAVNYGPVDSLPYKVELKHKTWRNIRHLVASGVTFGLMSDHPVSLQAMLFLQLRWFLRCGLSRSAAIGVITSRNARLLGVDDVLGTLAAGKWASFVCWNGDPFDITSHPVAVYAEGRKIF